MSENNFPVIHCAPYGLLVVPVLSGFPFRVPVRKRTGQ